MAAETDYREILETVYRYAAGIDRRDWSLYRSIFTDAVEVDFSSYDGKPPMRCSVDEWLDRIRPLFEGLDATQHVMTNPRVAVDGGSAVCEMYVQAIHVLRRDGSQRTFTIGGYYTDRLVRRDDGWKLSAVRLTVLWSDGDRRVMHDARSGA